MTGRRMKGDDAGRTAGRAGRAESAGHTAPVHGIADRLSAAFPGAVVWFGLHTRRWWALTWLDGGWRLIDAPTPDGLMHTLIHHRFPPRP